MPARTRFSKQALVIFLVVLLGFTVARIFSDADAPSYTLSNSVDLSSDGIATNSILIGSQLPEIKLISADGQEVSTQSLLDTPLIINVWY